jgi:hypothetical protein
MGCKNGGNEDKKEMYGVVLREGMKGIEKREGLERRR